MMKNVFIMSLIDRQPESGLATSIYLDTRLEAAVSVAILVFLLATIEAAEGFRLVDWTFTF